MIQLKGEEKLSLEQIFNLIGKINAIIYARVSTADQAKKGYSIESQIEMCKQRALSKFGFKENELVVVIEDGRMGDDPNRPGLNYVLYLLEKGIGKKLIMLHPDRFTRDNTLQGVISRRIWSMGIDIEFIEFEVDPDNPESMLMYNIQGSIAQYNKAKILANSRRGRVQKARKGELPSFKRLYGYKYDKKIQLLEINDEEAMVYIDMVDMLLNQDMSCNQIAQELSRKGIPAPNGDIWYQTTVTRILRNESYTGNYYYGKSKVVQKDGEKKQVPQPREEWIKIAIPPLIDEETFLLIQKKIDALNKAKGRKSKSYLLKGIVKCGRCGASAGSGITSKVKSGVYKYYSCRNKSAKGYIVGTGKKAKKCEGVNWRVDIVDEIVWKWLLDKINNPETVIKEITKELSDTHKLSSLEKQKDEIQKKLIELEKEETNYAILFGKGKITEKQFDDLTNPIKRQTESLQYDLNIIKSNLITLKGEYNETELIKKNIKKFQEVIKGNLEMKDKRTIVQMFVERVILNEDFTIEIITKWGSNESNPNQYSQVEKNAYPHKKQNNVQTYGRQTAYIHINIGGIFKGNGLFFELESRTPVPFSACVRVS